MFIPIYNGKTTSMIYIPQSHTHEHDYNTETREQGRNENYTAGDFLVDVLFGIRCLSVLFMCGVILCGVFRAIKEEW